MESSKDQDDIISDNQCSDISHLTSESGTVGPKERVVIDSVTGKKRLVVIGDGMNDQVSGLKKKTARGLFSCKQCCREFSWKNSLRRHILTVHKNYRPYVCSQCDYTASEHFLLTRHVIKAHTQSDDDLLHCDLCSYSSLEKSKLKRHLNSVHRGIKPFQCDNCKFFTDDRSRLKRHVFSVHGSLKPFRCPHCDHSTSEKCNLKIHIMSVHLQIKPFACKFCDYSSSEKGTLNRHIRAIHKSKDRAELQFNVATTKSG